MIIVLLALFYHQYITHRREPVAGIVFENAPQVHQFNHVVLGCALVGLSGLLGAVYCFFSCEWGGTVVLMAVTSILLMQARPR